MESLESSVQHFLQSDTNSAIKNMTSVYFLIKPEVTETEW